MTTVAALDAEPLRVPKMAELVARQLRRHIVSGELVGGQSLPSEAALMTRFGVSRPTLREAFRVLESEGLISVRRGAHGGARVHTPDDSAAARYAGLVLEYRGTTLHDVYEARNIIEPPCAARLARRHTRAQLNALTGQLGLTRTHLDDPAVAIDLLNDFHALVVELTGNQTLTVLSGMLRQIIERSTVRQAFAMAGSAQGTAAMRAGFREHEKVVALIAVGEGEAADRTWRRHLSAAELHALPPVSKETVLDLLD